MSGERPVAKPRLRVRYAGAGKWVCEAMPPDIAMPLPRDAIERSPEGTEAEAEGYMDNFRRFGAWKKS